MTDANDNLRKRCWWGWGYADSQMDFRQIENLGQLLNQTFNTPLTISEEPKLSEGDLPAPKFKIDKNLEAFVVNDPYERARHSYGSSFKDVCLKLNKELSQAPDYVLYPKCENDVINILDFANENNIAVIPYGGGSSVVGGVNTGGESVQDYKGVISLDLTNLNQIVEIDHISRSARIQGGILGPKLEAGLKPHNLTLRHFPQSFECSSLGGWLATRSGGHYATGRTHIDDFVESVRVVSPNGIVQSRKLPASGAGINPNAIFLGSEGSFGIITEAWMRLQVRPHLKARLEASFNSFEEGAFAVKDILQSGLQPSNCRLLDPLEAAINAGGDGSKAMLLLAFESHIIDPMPLLNLTSKVLEDSSHRPVEIKIAQTDKSLNTTQDWKRSFLKMPYTRDAMVRLGVVAETFETAITWDKFFNFHKMLVTKLSSEISKDSSRGWITCRFTHAYPDGPAPYYSVVLASKRDYNSRISQWEYLKDMASEIIVSSGATITHHHGVGKDHVKYYQREIPYLFDLSLRNLKSVFDPNFILNPSVLGLAHDMPSR